MQQLWKWFLKVFARTKMVLATKTFKMGLRCEPDSHLNLCYCADIWRLYSALSLLWFLEKLRKVEILHLSHSLFLFFSYYALQPPLTSKGNAHCHVLAKTHSDKPRSSISCCCIHVLPVYLYTCILILSVYLYPRITCILVYMYPRITCIFVYMYPRITCILVLLVSLYYLYTCITCILIGLCHVSWCTPSCLLQFILRCTV